MTNLGKKEGMVRLGDTPLSDDRCFINSSYKPVQIGDWLGSRDIALPVAVTVHTMAVSENVNSKTMKKV